MRKLALAVTICATLATMAGDTQSLVDAAKGAKEKKRKSTTKVITNADVKKAKSVVARKPSADATVPQKTAPEQHKLSYRESLERETQLTVLQTRVSDLERELAAVEQSYYEEDDLDKRDGDILKRFNDVKSKLDAARKELDEFDPPATSSE